MARAPLLHRIRQRRHTALLVALVILFAVRPLIGDAEVSTTVFSAALLTVLLIALYTIQIDDTVGERRVLLRHKRRRTVGVALAVLAIAARLASLWAGSRRALALAAISWLLFLGFVTWSQLRSLLKQREITGEAISMSISIYLLIGLMWGLLYIGIFQQQPAAFSFGSPADDAAFQALPPEHAFATFIYFSLVTLATVGYGHIYPVAELARYAAVAQAIVGQFYIAVLVARLVGMQMSQSAERERDHAKRER